MKEDMGKASSFVKYTFLAWPIFVFAAVYWIFDVIVDSFIFHNTDFFTSLIHPDSMCLFMRMVNIPLITVFVVIAQWSLIKRRSAEEKIRAILETIPDPVVMYDIQGYPKYLNPAFTQAFGWSLDELRNKRIPFVPDDQKDITGIKIKELFDFGKPVRIESKRLTKEGLLLDVHISAALTKDSDGKSTGMVVNLTDITERKKLEEEQEKLVHELQNALAKVKILSGLLPICAHCKNIRDDKGYWNKIESYIHQRSEAEFSHGICPECAKKFYPDFDLNDDSE